MMYFVYVRSTVDASKVECQRMDEDQYIVAGTKVLQHTVLRAHEERMPLSKLQKRYPYIPTESQ